VGEGLYFIQARTSRNAII